MFLGTFEPKLSANDQLALPAKIRSGLGSDRAILTTGFDRCIYGFTLEDWKRITDLELEKPLSTVEGRQIRQKMFAKACEIDLDDQGRFVLPATLKEFANIDAQIVIIGAGDHFEIWNLQDWNKYSAQQEY